jgi:hypothetical protein
MNVSIFRCVEARRALSPVNGHILIYVYCLEEFQPSDSALVEECELRCDLRRLGGAALAAAE